MFRELCYFGWDFVKPLWKNWVSYNVADSNTVGELEKALDGLI